MRASSASRISPMHQAFWPEAVDFRPRGFCEVNMGATSAQICRWAVPRLCHGKKDKTSPRWRRSTAVPGHEVGLSRNAVPPRNVKPDGSVDRSVCLDFLPFAERNMFCFLLVYSRFTAHRSHFFFFLRKQMKVDGFRVLQPGQGFQLGL